MRTYDVICESTMDTPPAEQRGALDRVKRGLRTYDEAQAAADDFITRFGACPDVRVLIWDEKVQRTIVVHEAAA